ncbi:lipid A-modifier LpxR family protein [Brevundimonas sp. Marseille-Q4549]
MRSTAWIIGMGGVLAMAGATAATAQIRVPNAFDDSPARPALQPGVHIDPQARFGGEIDIPSALRPADNSAGLVATTRHDVWIDRADFTDRVTLETAGRLRRADGSPLPVSLGERAELSPEAYDLRYVRGFRGAHGHTPSGLEVSLTPHAGVGVGSEGRSAEAGVTLKIGEGLDRLAPDGDERFGQRPRWYVYAAGSGRAVGYNFARTRDGDYARSGYTQDRGAFLGDASIGVAYRRGDVQTSVGVVYREIDAGKGLRGANGLDTDVSEGLIAFQLSIKPRR